MQDLIEVSHEKSAITTGDELHKIFQAKITRIFLGETPQELRKVTPEVLTKVNAIFAEINFSQPINLIKLIQDVGEVFSASQKKSAKRKEIKLTRKELNELKYVARVVVHSAYMEAIDEWDAGKHWEESIEDKINLGKFIVQFLNTIEEIYGIQIMESQTDFIKKIEINNFSFALIPGIVNSIPEEHFHIYQVSDCWIYTKQQLQSLSKQLYANGYIKNEDDFRQVFMKKPLRACDWGKSKRSFIYLIMLLYKGTNQVPNPMFKFCAERFTFGGEETTTAQLQTQYGQIGDSILKYGRDLLKPGYLPIFDICVSIFPNLKKK